MKRRFTILTAAFALLAFLAIPMGMWGQTTYEQLTSIANIDESAQYVLGIDETGFHYSGTSSWGLTALPSAQTPIYYTLTKASDGNSFTAQATISGTTYYLQIPTSNTFSMATSAGTNTDIIIGTTQVQETNYAVANKTTTARHLRINGTSGLRSYAGTTGAMAFFYKVVTSGSGTTYTVTFDAGDGTFVGSTDFPNASNTMAAGTYTLPSAERSGYTFDGWTATGITTPITDSYTVSEDIDFTAQYTQNSGSGVTATLTQSNLELTGSYTTNTSKTIDGITYVYTDLMKSSDNIQAKASTGTIKNTTAYPGDITEVKITHSGTARATTINGSADGTNWTQVATGSGSITADFSGRGYKYFQITRGSNAAYWTKIEITYSTGGSSQSQSDLAITNASTDLTFDLYNNATAQVINYTTSSTGAITITPAESSYFTYVHDATAKTITVTPTAVTPSAQTVTISQEADEDYYAGTASFTVSVANSDPTIPGTVNNPYTVAQARAAIDADTGTQGVFVTGIVSENNYYSQSNHYITYFISADGSTESDQLEAFHGKGINGADFTSADDIQVGDIVVIYGNLTKYNSTYELAEGNQLVSLERPTPPSQEYTLTVTASENVEIFTFVGESTDPGVEGSTTLQVYNGTEVGLSVSATTGYVLTLMVDGEDVTSELDDTGYYTFTMPAHDVTVSATAVEDVPPTAGEWVLTDLADLTENDVFVIVGTRSDATYAGDYAMSNDNGTSNPPAAVAVTVAEGTLSAEPAANLQWNLSITENGYTFYPNGTTETWLYCTNTNNGVRVGTNENNVFTMGEDGYLFNTATSRYIGIYNSQDWRCYSNTTGNIANQTFAFYKKVTEPTPTEYTLTIEGYEDDTNEGGYYLIASPVTVDLNNHEMTTGDFDLYAFDQAEDDEWRNYEAGAFTSLEPGKGYLYAHKTGGEFTLTGTPYDGNGIIELVYDDNAIDFKGWNLVGNPWGVKAYPDHAFYTMAEGGAGIDVTPNVAGTEVAAMTGIFVVAEGEDETVSFSTTQPGQKSVNLALNITNSSKLVDRAIVRFGEGRQLPKFQLRDNSTKIYFEQSNKDYAIVNAEEIGEMPVSFKAEKNGTYTFSVNTENVEMEYLHLIDNMTGADIDLIANPSYSFEAKVTDYASRFRLVFSANSSVNEQNANNFAFFNGNDWTINNEGEATLQVVDMTGRVLSTETVNGNATTKVNAATGVYMLRLINGNNIKTQKVVVK